ncbi:SDR family NAD(P)-dependent oxidoreductase [Actinoplanes regularis]|uniref:NADP-dependent 3-hydroxy acid dehydrogenase YdfG n=1 Tax=Actinoplanes regularis TaxID=52697 RepID=A0A238W6Z5_9ACTN|nr:SDR family oxidoreductase [Actinoplanes regularis]GIE85225.1 short-chain dehydrogenase [Actinoplanes regularis]SNR42064.1 NADP-dependent 3-hydroxy acid dehydrogenase YdfG [Actinoplanes regularis]
MRVAGKTLVVTGAGGEIGRAITLEAVRRGARVAAVDADPDALRETARQVVAPPLLSTHVADVADPAGAAGLPPVVIERWQLLDGLIHCAGAVPGIDHRPGTLHLARTFLPLLRLRPQAHLVGVVPAYRQAVHGAAKAAVEQFAEGLRAECAGTNVHVTAAFLVDEAGVVKGAYRAAREILDGMERNVARVRAGSETPLLDRLGLTRAARPA